MSEATYSLEQTPTHETSSICSQVHSMFQEGQVSMAIFAKDGQTGIAVRMVRRETGKQTQFGLSVNGLRALVEIGSHLLEVLDNATVVEGEVQS